MQKSKSNHSVFYRNSSSRIILLVVYVNDIVITGRDSKGISSLKSCLHNQFHTKDLGMLRYFMGIEVIRSKRGIFLSQRKYVLDLLSETGNRVLMHGLVNSTKQHKNLACKRVNLTTPSSTGTPVHVSFCW